LLSSLPFFGNLANAAVQTRKYTRWLLSRKLTAAPAVGSYRLHVLLDMH